MENYKFKTGDGITWKTCTVQEREEVYKLLKKHKYPLYSTYSSNGYGYINQFENNFKFNKQGKWCTSSVKDVTNPMTYQQIKNLIETGGVPQYDIY